jgi:filamentous hemagglutinin family protein
MGRRSAGGGDVVIGLGPARRLALGVVAAVTLALVPSGAGAQVAPGAQPTGGTVVAGTATIVQTSTTTSVNQTSQRAVISWQSFDVGATHRVELKVPSASAVTLLRVTQADPAEIAGQVTSNGTILLTNAAGIVLDSGAQTSGHGIVLSAAGSTTAHFMGGGLILDGSPNPDARITVGGAVQAAQGGVVGFVAPAVNVSGTVDAAGGTVSVLGAAAATFGASTGASIDRQVTRVPVVGGAPVAALVTITGVVRADGGTVQIETGSATGVIARGVSLGGSVTANHLPGLLGHVQVRSTGSGVTVKGTLQALGGSNLTGGTVQVNASGSVTVAATAKVNASGGLGGGTIAVGMAVTQARAGTCPTSDRPTTVTVAAGAVLRAASTAKGPGGAIALAGATVSFKGTAAVPGGPNGGNGGTVELAATTLHNGGTTDVSAPKGQPGSVVILHC